jgi:hypothetical protein
VVQVLQRLRFLPVPPSLPLDAPETSVTQRTGTNAAGPGTQSSSEQGSAVHYSARMDERRAARQVFSLLAQPGLSSRERRLIAGIAAATIAEGRESARLTSLQLEAATSISARHVRWVVPGLERKGLIRRRANGNAYEIALTLGERPVPAPELPREAARGDEKEALRELVEQARDVPPAPQPASQAVVDLTRLAGQAVIPLARELEASSIGRDLLQRLVRDLRDADRASDGRILTPQGARPASDVALDQLRHARTIVHAMS